MTQDASLSPLGSNVSNPHRWGGKSENGPRGDIPTPDSPPRLRRPPPSAAAAEPCTTLPHVPPPCPLCIPNHPIRLHVLDCYIHFAFLLLLEWKPSKTSPFLNFPDFSHSNSLFGQNWNSTIKIFHGNDKTSGNFTCFFFVRMTCRCQSPRMVHRV